MADENLTGRFAGLRGAGGPGREHQAHAGRLAWNRHLAAAGWTCLGWPAEFGGHEATLTAQVIFYEEHARSGAPARVGYLGEEPARSAARGPQLWSRWRRPRRSEDVRPNGCGEDRGSVGAVAGAADREAKSRTRDWKSCRAA